MKFDFCIGNPPYQTQTTENANRQEPIYHRFLDAAYTVSDRVCLIHPARFLFNAGQTPTAWNKKMLADTHLTVLNYVVNANEIFSNTDIKGGIAVTYRDTSKNFGPITLFIPHEELRSATIKVKAVSNHFLSEIIYGQSNFCLDELYKDHPAFKSRIHGEGRSKQIRSNAFEKFPEIFIDTEDDNHKLKMYGFQNHSRQCKFVPEKYIEKSANQDFYKVIIPQANGSGAIGEVLSTPVMGTPVMGYTQSFIGVGAFKTEIEAINCLQYVKTKFARAMLGTLKITQNNAAPEIWSNIPLQDFTSESDINWSKSIPEIDQQLYKKYGLSQDEIDFIETKVRPMDNAQVEEDDA